MRCSTIQCVFQISLQSSDTNSNNHAGGDHVSRPGTSLLFRGAA